MNPLFQYSITPSSAKRGVGFPPPPFLSKVITFIISSSREEV
jgi:hypothetical protein